MACWVQSHLHVPMIIYGQLETWEQISLKFYEKYTDFRYAT